jgi:undecaprenyl-diphosphatase
MTFLDAIILGIVEGLTEFLPVSSTGHLILTNALLGVEGGAADAYVIVIQLGAILSVVTLYRAQALAMLQGLMGRNRPGLDLFLKLCAAFFPAAVAGLLFDEMIERLLFHPGPVAVALVAGGAAMIVVERWHQRRMAAGQFVPREIDSLSFKDAVLVGSAQCLALWPGTSRSMSTILGAQLLGFSNIAAAELSFLLALPTLGAATVYRLLDSHEELAAVPNGLWLVLVGNVVAFVVALLAIKGFLRIVMRRGMMPFGVYRIVLGLVFLGLIAAGVFPFSH